MASLRCGTSHEQVVSKFYTDEMELARAFPLFFPAWSPSRAACYPLEAHHHPIVHQYPIPHHQCGPHPYHELLQVVIHQFVYNNIFFMGLCCTLMKISANSTDFYHLILLLLFSATIQQNDLFTFCSVVFVCSSWWLV